LKVELSEQKRIVENLKGLVDSIPEVEAKLAELNRDYDVTHKRYLELVDRRESARLSDMADQSSSEMTIRVIEAPVVPVLPSSPKRKLLLFAVLIFAFGAGLGWCVLRYLITPTVTNSRQLRQEFEIPVFGTVSNTLTRAHLVKRSIQLTSFLSVIFLLVVLFGVVFIFREKGTDIARQIIENNDINTIIVGLKSLIGFHN
jgi:hypothetical protein